VPLVILTSGSALFCELVSNQCCKADGTSTR
jgi:hypothetical protein